MPNKTTRALLTIVLALLASVALVWWRNASRVAPPANTADATTASDPAAELSGPSLSAPAAGGVRTAGTTAPVATEPATASTVPPEIAGTGLWVRVIDDRGEAKPGVRLQASQELRITLGQEHPDEYCLEELMTDANGRARITARQASEIETISLITAAGVTLTAEGPFEIAAGRTDEVLLLYPEPVTIKGRILDLSGAPVTTSVRVELYCRKVAATAAGAFSFAGESEVTYADDEGRFAFERFAGWYSLSAAEPGVPASEWVHIGIVGPVRTVDIPLYIGKGERLVRVKVVSTTPFEPSDISVGAVGELAWPADTKIEGVSIERVRQPQVVHAPYADGAWQLELPRGGPWKVRAGGYVFEYMSVPLPPDANEITLTLVRETLREEIVLSGRIVDPNNGPLSGSITLFRASDLEQFDQVEAAADGFFRWRLGPSPQDDTHAYLFASLGGRTGGLGPISIERARDSLEIVLRPGLTIAGRVHGLPPGVEARVSLRSRPSRFEHAELPPKSEWLPLVLEREQTTTSAGGLFRLRGVPAGEYELWAMPRDSVTLPARMRVNAGDENVRVELGTGLKVTLTLLCRVVDDTTGAVISGAEVSLARSRTGAKSYGSSGRTDATGTCTLAGHAAGSWHVFAKAPGYAFAPERFTDLAAGEQFVEVRLARACTLDLKFQDPSGTPRSGVSVGVTTLQGDLVGMQNRYGNFDVYYTRSDASGRVVARGLPAGRVRVVVGWKDGARVDVEDFTNPFEVFSPANAPGLLVIEQESEPGRRGIVTRVLP